MSRPNILIVDDSPNILKALRRTLRGEDYTVHCALSAQEAMTILTVEDIDVVISDENMPGRTGTDLLKTARELQPDVVRMMLTGNTDVEVAKRAINEGAIYRFFTKPWDDFEIVVAVRQALEMRYLGRENSQLKATIEERDRLLSRLEQEHPGISNIAREADGSYVIE